MTDFDRFQDRKHLSYNNGVDELQEDPAPANSVDPVLDGRGPQHGSSLHLQLATLESEAGRLVQVFLHHGIHNQLAAAVPEPALAHGDSC